MPLAAHRGRLAVAMALLAGIAAIPSARAQSVPADAARVARLNQEVAFSLFVLTNSGFTAGGYARYDDDSTAVDFSIYSLPLRQRFHTGLLGPTELRVTVSTGQATTNLLENLSGIPGAVAADRSLLNAWNGRVDIGRPIALAEGLEFTPLLGLGYSAWTGKTTLQSVGSVPFPAIRADLWADALLYEAIGILEYRHRWRGLTITPGLAVNYTYIDSFDGRADLAATPGVAPRRTRVSLSGSSTLLRAATRVQGPLGRQVADLPLLWQGFVVAAYEASDQALFPWSVEIGGALGVDAGPVGRRLAGFDPGSFFLGASYIVGKNLQGVRANFGFRF